MLPKASQIALWRILHARKPLVMIALFQVRLVSRVSMSSRGSNDHIDQDHLETAAWWLLIVPCESIISSH